MEENKLSLEILNMEQSFLSQVFQKNETIKKLIAENEKLKKELEELKEKRDKDG